MDREIKICVIGLGYVGLPLARLFSTKYNTVGFDMSSNRVNALMSGHDTTLEVPDELLQTALANGFVCTSDIDAIRDCNFCAPCIMPAKRSAKSFREGIL